MLTEYMPLVHKWAVRSRLNLCVNVCISCVTMTDAPTKQKLWGGRFTGKTDPLYVNC
jgi:hypothetical protein